MNDHSLTGELLLLKTRRPDTRNELRREALRLFAERGYAAVSMRDIAEAVGVRQGAIYNHFAGKQDLLAALMIEHMETLILALDEALSGESGPIARLQAFVRFHVGYHIDKPDDVFIAYMELRNLEPEGRERVHALRNRYEAVLRDVLAEGLRNGAFRGPDAAVQARALIAMMTGVTVWYREGGRLGRRDVIESYVQITLQSVGIDYPIGGED
ncbi:TetR/AcrR family transcriptional regulator [Notoacmeibacter ruber]|uniref:TetR/AcrR family transcriptional regulator n=1 Tax=Notoacmeibacter ruber TaxID=2670375 RepID=A0A3L7JDZ9_9HYPH|nr:TetR/AcrR family transcriptional regulator [Notoacmeibacter ruber]RLQ88535.1 TetR/AcrR family transcriptional regulator [Notoacmeibacter ruber]